MSGVRTLSDLRGRCRVDDLTGCWLWSGAMSAGVPRVWSALAGRTVTGSRLAWQLATGKVPARGLTIYRATCCDARCVRPRHLRAGTKAEAGEALRTSGKLRGDPLRALCNRRNGMRTSKASPELRLAILASDEPGLHLAPRLGISHSTISNVRRGKRWAGLAGPFDWLIAA